MFGSPAAGLSRLRDDRFHFAFSTDLIGHAYDPSHGMFVPCIVVGWQWNVIVQML
jgi:hypothetical protein